MTGRERVAVAASLLAVALVLAGAWLFLPAAIPGAVTLLRVWRRRRRVV